MNWMYLPKWVYELLPVGYFFGGLAAAAMSPNVLGILSGLALAAAGIQIWSQRRRYRQLQATQRSAMDERLHRARMSRLT